MSSTNKLIHSFINEPFYAHTVTLQAKPGWTGPRERPVDADGVGEIRPSSTGYAITGRVYRWPGVERIQQDP